MVRLTANPNAVDEWHYQDGVWNFRDSDLNCGDCDKAFIGPDRQRSYFNFRTNYWLCERCAKRRGIVW